MHMFMHVFVHVYQTDPGQHGSRMVNNTAQSIERIDLNCDMGESFGSYILGMDEEVIHHISSANIACGFHAGDPQVMRRTVRLALAHGVAIGAHPGFPDLLGFGRRGMHCTLAETEDYITYQVGALQAFCQAEGGRLHHVKPHGALYNQIATDPAMLRAIARAIQAIDPTLLLMVLAGPNATELGQVAAEEGVQVVLEAFPDRVYESDGTLRARTKPDAVIHDATLVATRALNMVQHGVIEAHDGTLVPMQVHSLCVHGDGPNSVGMVATIKNCFAAAGIRVAAVAADLKS